MKHLQFMLIEIDAYDPPDEGPFYVIEKFHEPAFVLDENGDPKCFDTYLEATAEADDCQNGFVLSF